MPNLNQNYQLKEKYFQLNTEDARVKKFIESNEASDVLEKAFIGIALNEDKNALKLFAILNEDLNPSKPELIKYFDESKEEDVVLLFIDISSFSKTISTFSNSEIKTYLDEYYEIIIPIIYKHGGVIEKLMGDGIICVFGKPFLDLPNLGCVYNAEDCAEEVIKEFFGTNKNLKVAIHKGTINYYKVPGEHYGEYTIIGQPITDLYRLESVSKENAVNFYASSNYDKLGWSNSIFDENQIIGANVRISKLQGVEYSQIRTIQFPGFI